MQDPILNIAFGKLIISITLISLNLFKIISITFCAASFIIKMLYKCVQRKMKFSISPCKHYTKYFLIIYLERKKNVKY